MATCTWTGKSGTKYSYNVSKLPCSFKPGKGNYIYAKRSVTPGKWNAVYIGEGELEDRSKPDSHQKGNCIKRNGATHFHWHRRKAGSAASRRAEESDLIQNCSPPCNG